jgi:crotonobetainyl-CoA:carnitine CoA-transferase CaiB-like acyl-CoA transferase
VTNPARVEHRAALRVALETSLRTRTAEEWIAVFTAANIPAGRVNSVAQAIELAESLGLDAVAQTSAVAPDGSRQNLRSIATPISFSLTPPLYDAPPPGVGEHQDATWLPR